MTNKTQLTKHDFTLIVDNKEVEIVSAKYDGFGTYTIIYNKTSETNTVSYKKES